MQGHRDCAIHHMVVKDLQATEVSTSRQELEWTTMKKINCCKLHHRFTRLSVPFDVKDTVFKYSSPGIIINCLNPLASV